MVVCLLLRILLVKRHPVGSAQAGALSSPGCSLVLMVTNECAINSTLWHVCCVLFLLGTLWLLGTLVTCSAFLIGGTLVRSLPLCVNSSFVCVWASVFGYERPA